MTTVQSPAIANENEEGTTKAHMIDHVILTVSDFGRSVAFYAKALKPLGITNFTDYEGHAGHPDLKGFGDGKRAFFWLKEGKPDPQAVHVGFVAKDHAEVCMSLRHRAFGLLPVGRTVHFHRFKFVKIVSGC